MAEHLAVTDGPAVARLIVEAADRDPAAPTLTGADRARVDALRARLDAELAAAAVAAAAADDRATVLEHARAALRALLAP